MKQKVYRAFGYIITKTEFDIGDTMTESVGYCVANRFQVHHETNFELAKDQVDDKEYNHIWLITKGQVDCVVEETGYKYSRGPGFCTLVDGNPYGTIRGDIVDGLDLFCIAPYLNIHRVPVVPKVTFFKLGRGEVINMSNTKLFLASGSMKIDNTLHEITSQVKINDNRTIEGLTDCYGLIFN